METVTATLIKSSELEALLKEHGVIWDRNVGFVHIRMGYQEVITLPWMWHMEVKKSKYGDDYSTTMDWLTSLLDTKEINKNGSNYWKWMDALNKKGILKSGIYIIEAD